MGGQSSTANFKGFPHDRLDHVPALHNTIGPVHLYMRENSGAGPKLATISRSPGCWRLPPRCAGASGCRQSWKRAHGAVDRPLAAPSLQWSLDARDIGARWSSRPPEPGSPSGCRDRIVIERGMKMSPETPCPVPRTHLRCRCLMSAKAIPCPFCRLPKAPGSGHVLEVPPLVVAEHALGQAATHMRNRQPQVHVQTSRRCQDRRSSPPSW